MADFGSSPVPALAAIRRFLLLALLSGTLLVLVASCQSRGPARLVLGAPDLSAPSDRFTRARLQLLNEEALCRQVLSAAFVPHRVLPGLRQSDGCGYPFAVVRQSRAGSIAWTPDQPGMSCPVAAGLVIWEREVVQPAAERHFGSRVTGIRHFGSYSCRRLYGRESGNLSEHARANAIDIAGFRLASGREISLLSGWQGTPEERAFLRDIRDGACRLFATVLSPDYNAAHADHFHFDQAERGLGWSICR